MKIANVLHKTNLVNHKKMNHINYCNSLDKCISDLPTLVVGWSLLKSIDLGININILNKEILKGKYYWEYSFDENKQEHVNGIELWTINLPYNYFNNRYEYKYLDPTFNEIYQDTLFEYLDNLLNYDSIKIYIYKRNFIYFLKGKKDIYGIDLNWYKFYGFDVDQIIDKIKDTNHNVFDDLNGEIHDNYSNLLPNYRDLKRHLVTLL